MSTKILVFVVVALVSIGLGAMMYSYLTNVPLTLKPIVIKSSDLHPADKEIYYESQVLIIENGTETRFQGLIPPFNSDVTIVASGKCAAGINHQAHPPKYLTSGITSVVAELGPTEILGCSDVNVRFVRGQGIFQVSEETRNQLHAQVMKMMPEQALKDGLAEKASQQAKIIEENKLRNLGFKNISVKIQE